MTLEEEALELYQTIIKSRESLEAKNTLDNYNTEPSAAEQAEQAAQAIVEKIYNRVKQRPALLSCSVPNTLGAAFAKKGPPLFFVLSHWRMWIMGVQSPSYAEQEYDWFVDTDFSIFSEDYFRRDYICAMSYFILDNKILEQNFVDIDKLVNSIKRQVPDSKEVLSELSAEIINEHFRDIKCKEVKREEYAEKFSLEQRQNLAHFIKRMRAELVVGDDTHAFCSIKQESHWIGSALKYFANQEIVPGYEALRQPSSDFSDADNNGTKIVAVSSSSSTWSNQEDEAPRSKRARLSHV